MWNAAHLPPEWAAEQLAGRLSSNPHNPRIAYAFFRAGMIEAWGRGIQRIVEICQKAGNPVPRWELQATGDGLWTTFPFSAAYQASDITSGSSADKKTTQETAQETTRERILALLKAEPELTQRMLG